MSQVRPRVVSAIIAVFNRPHLLAEAVESVLAQTYRPIEIVIVDDGSTDGTGEVARGYVTRYPGIVRYLHQENQYYPAAWNTGIDHLTGEFVQFLDSDDLLLPEKFERQVAGLRAHPECGISYCYMREYPLGEAWSGRPARQSAETFTELFPQLLSGKIWPSPAPLYRREVVNANGHFLRVAVQPDWEYECRAAARHTRLHHCREYLGETRGTHRVEGRQKGGVPDDKLADYVLVLERILAHARCAGAAGPAIDGFSRKLFVAAQRCGAAGLEAEARRCLTLALGAASSPRNRLDLMVYRAAADRLGVRRAGAWWLGAEQSAAMRALGAGARVPGAYYRQWRHRAAAAVAAVSGKPVREWPGVLARRWSGRASRGAAIS